MLRDVYLHGALGQRFGAVIELDVDTAGSAVRALSLQLPGFAEELRTGSWHVVRGDTDTGDGLELGDINTFQLGHAPLHFVPALAGSKNGGATLKAVLGVALVGTAFALSGGTLATPIMMGSLATGLSWGNVAMMGAAMALGGVSAFLSPESKSGTDEAGSYLFNGPGTTYAQGNPVPLVYGDIITGGYLVSAGLDIEKLS